MWEIILDAFLDTLIVLPFLIIIYILIEFLEHRTTFTRNHKILQGNPFDRLRHGAHSAMRFFRYGGKALR